MMFINFLQSVIFHFATNCRLEIAFIYYIHTQNTIMAFLLTIGELCPETHETGIIWRWSITRRRGAICIPSIDESHYIITVNFKVEQLLPIVFKAEHCFIGSHIDITNTNNASENQHLLKNAKQKVASSKMFQEDIIELSHREIEINDGNELAPENAWASSSQSTTVGEFTTLINCPCKSSIYRSCEL